VLGEHIATVALVLLYLLSMFGWGSLLLKVLPGWHSIWDDVVSRLITGCGVLYLLFVALGAAGILRPLEVGITLGTGILISVFFVPSLFKYTVDWKEWQTTDLILLCCVGTLAILQMIFGLTPLIFYDLQVYHLLAPAHFLKAGSFDHIPWSVFTNSPLALQLTVGMSLAVDSSGQLAKVLFTILGCLMPVAVFELLRSVGRRAALLAALFVLCFPEFWLMQSFGVVDVSIAGLMLFGTLWLRLALRQGEWRDIVLAGIAFGMAVGSRYQAVLLTLWVVLALVTEKLVTDLRGIPDRKTILQVGAMLLLVAALVSPWLIRNYEHMGNPVYPLMSGVWGTPEWSEAQAAQVNNEVLGPSLMDLGAKERVMAPFGALFMPASNGLFGTALFFGALIALMLGNRELRLISIVGLGGLLLWGLMRPMPGVPLLRFNAMSLVLLLAATGAVLAHGQLLSRIGYRIAGVLAGGSFIIAMFHAGRVIPVFQSVTNAESRRELQRANVPAWAAFEYVNRNLDPAHHKVLLMGETRAFWLQVPYIAPSCFNGPQLDTIFGGQRDQWREALTRLGVSHLVISTSELQRLHKQYGYFGMGSDRLPAFDEWIRTLPLLFDDGRGTLVLALDEAPIEQIKAD
jgi:hypothetical protein